MDDPWGSPWADEAPHPSPPKVLEPTIKPPVISGNTLSLDRSSSSPWDDDDGFGEWAAVPGSDGGETSVQEDLEESVAAGERAPVARESTPGNEANSAESGSTSGEASSPWFNRETTATSPTNFGVEVPKLASGQQSSDPWAEMTVDELVTSHQIQGEPLDAKYSSKRIETALDQASTQAQTDDEVSLHGTKVDRTLQQSLSSDELHKGLVEENSFNTTLNAKDQAQDESPTSRPSSSPSDHSHRDDILTESPRTSFEEEVKRPKDDGEGPSKVKELVRLFDGIAVTAEGESTTTLRVPDVSAEQCETPVAGISEDDFGDFEEGKSSAVASSLKEELVQENVEEELERVKSDPDDSLVSDDKHEQLVADIANEPSKFHGPIKFDTDLTQLGHVFDKEIPGLEIRDADPGDALTLENVISDSFSSTDQRKTWYRISRYGSLRKHNGGDEDNYIGINWKSSQMRIETLKIVARWIDEDRIGGGVILGGGTKLGSMFGWGQKDAAPISVAAALASKIAKPAAKADRAQISSSLSLEGSRSKRSSLDYSSTSRTFQSPKSPAAAQFSWSTGSPTSSTMGRTSHELSSPTSAMSRRPLSGALPSPFVLKPPTLGTAPMTLANPPTTNITLAQAPPPKQRPQPQKPTIAATAAARPEISIKALPAAEILSVSINTDVEDEWGEMMSSPALEPISPARSTCGGQQPSRGHVEAPNQTWGKVPSPLVNSYALPSSFPTNTPSPTVNQSQETAPSTEQQPASSEPIPQPATKSDPWGTVNFSFFDTLSAPLPRPQLNPLEAPLQPSVASLPSRSTDTNIDKIPVPPYSPKPITATTTPYSARTKEQEEQDRIVETIVKNLPDLSYMLRR